MVRVMVGRVRTVRANVSPKGIRQTVRNGRHVSLDAVAHGTAAHDIR